VFQIPFHIIKGNKTLRIMEMIFMNLRELEQWENLIKITRLHKNEKIKIIKWLLSF
jgi:hypothetical protein